MFWLMFIAATIALGVADPEKDLGLDLEEIGSNSFYVQPDHQSNDHRRRYSENYGPAFRRPHEKDSVEDIIEHVNSPDYSQPTIVLDYRYLKTGGRDYVQGPGGQYLILPPGIRSKEPKKFRDFDAMLDHLKQKRKNERHDFKL